MTIAPLRNFKSNDWDLALDMDLALPVRQATLTSRYRLPNDHFSGQGRHIGSSVHPLIRRLSFNIQIQVLASNKRQTRDIARLFDTFGV
jgi:hypothetical protein